MDGLVEHGAVVEYGDGIEEDFGLHGLADG